MDYVGFYEQDPSINETGSWMNTLVTACLLIVMSLPAKTANISVVNYLAHGIGKGAGTRFIETAFRSDVHAVECGFVNSLPNGTTCQNAAGGSYTSAAQG